MLKSTKTLTVAFYGERSNKVVVDLTKRPIHCVCKMVIKSNQMYLLSTFNNKVRGGGSYVLFMFLLYCTPFLVFFTAV